MHEINVESSDQDIVSCELPIRSRMSKYARRIATRRNAAIRRQRDEKAIDAAIEDVKREMMETEVESNTEVVDSEYVTGKEDTIGDDGTDNSEGLRGERDSVVVEKANTSESNWSQLGDNAEFDEETSESDDPEFMANYFRGGSTAEYRMKKEQSRIEERMRNEFRREENPNSQLARNVAALVTCIRTPNTRLIDHEVPSIHVHATEKQRVGPLRHSRFSDHEIPFVQQKYNPSSMCVQRPMSDAW